jgi:hypothetical protein
MALSMVGRKIHRAVDEPVEMRKRRYGYFPQVFLWHGHCYRVHAVERCWTVVPRPHLGGRLCFRVRCAEGTFELYQDLHANTWHVHGTLAQSGGPHETEMLRWK